MKILVTGGAGFIGSNFVRYLHNKNGQDKNNQEIIILDAMTYASNIKNIDGIINDKNIMFYCGNICNENVVNNLMRNINIIINFAAETHVDRSIDSAKQFLDTNLFGTYVLLEAAKKYKIEKFIQISTDEVYGEIHSGSFTEESMLKPGNPYAASKAAADLLALSYYRTYGVPVVITRSSNNYGYYQHPEKFIPLAITNLIQDKPIPIYGRGENIRNWIFILDNCRAIEYVLNYGESGNIYNIGGEKEFTNIKIANLIIEYMNKPKDMIEFVNDRPGHDFRYSIEYDKMKKLGWSHKWKFEVGLLQTIRWYVKNEAWWKNAAY